MSKKYRVAVIGRTGRGDYGHNLDTVWLQVPNAEIVAVADENMKGLAAAAKRLSVEKTFSDYRKMLDEMKPDIVSICPRWIDQHRDMVVAAAERGIHMYCEKPLCRTLKEADEMVAACERTHAKLAMAHQTRYSPKLPVVQELLSSGKLGRVLEFRGRGKEDPRGGGLDLWVLGSHILDLIRALGGDPKWCFATVQQNGRPIEKQDVTEGAEGIGPLAGDAVNAMYGMPDGATAYFSSHRGAGNGARFALQVFGSAGVLEINFGYLPAIYFLPDPRWSPARSGAKWQSVSSAGLGKPEPLEDGGLEAGNLLAVQDLIAAIEDNRQPKCSVYDGRASIEMIAAVFESQRVREPVQFPLENRKNPLTMLS